MEQKKNKIRSILKQMRAEGITISDLQQEITQNPDFLPQKFDLLCLVNGVPQRLPFDKGRHMQPIAIFPFTGNWYLELAQDESVMRQNVCEDRLPDRDIWFEVRKLCDDLNAELRALNRPLLEGKYFARGGKLNWIVDFGDVSNVLPDDIFAPAALANIRYCGSL